MDWLVPFKETSAKAAKCKKTGEIYKKSPVDGELWSPHFYLRGDRLGFGALSACYDDGWEKGDQIYLY